MTHENNNFKMKGNVAVLLIVASAIGTKALDWGVDRLLNSPDRANAAIVSVETKLTSSITENSNSLGLTNQRVATLEADSKTVKDWLTRVEGKLDRVIAEKK